jgi:hypothetical protein
MNVKNTFRRVIKTLGSPKIGTGLMIVAASYQLVTAINALMDENKKLGFRVSDE